MSFNFAEVSDLIQSLQEEIDVIETAASSKTKPLKEQVKELEQQLMLAMQDAGLKTFKGQRSEAKVSETLRISISDFALLEQFVIRKKALQLFERRISSKAYAELKESLGNKPIPGLSEFKQPRISVNAAK